MKEKEDEEAPPASLLASTPSPLSTPPKRGRTPPSTNATTPPSSTATTSTTATTARTSRRAWRLVGVAFLAGALYAADLRNQVGNGTGSRPRHPEDPAVFTTERARQIRRQDGGGEEGVVLMLMENDEKSPPPPDAPSSFARNNAGIDDATKIKDPNSVALWMSSFFFGSTSTDGKMMAQVDDVEGRLVREANRFVLSRRDEYEATGVGVNWRIRGVGYLYEKQHVVLAARVVRSAGVGDVPSRHQRSSEASAGEEREKGRFATPTAPTRSIQIFNVYDPRLYHEYEPPTRDNETGPVDMNENGSTTPKTRHRRRMTTSRYDGPRRSWAGSGSSAPPRPRDDCDKLTVWVRAYGPEIFAGTARSVPATPHQDCYWTYDVPATVPGSYGVDIRVLVWNGKGRDYETEQTCGQKMTKGNLSQSVADVLFPLHAGFKGFKMYYPGMSCCEICNRMSPYCEAWSAPPYKLVGPRQGNMGCELYFKMGTPSREIPQSWILGDLNVTLAPHHTRRLKTVEFNLGRPHGADPQMFLGCGWSYWHTLDFPCLQGELDDKVFMLNDTFVLEEEDEDEASTASLRPAPSTPATDRRPLCGTDAELLGNTAGRWVQEPFPDDSECLVPFELDKNYSEKFEVPKYSGERPHCWHRDAIDRIGLQCMEPNCAFINRARYWTSRARVSRWMGVWREYSCDYVEFSDDELQRCIDVKKVTSIRTEGASVSSMLNRLIRQRIDPLTMYRNESDPDSIQVTISTLALLHRTMDSNSAYRRSLRAMKNATSRDVVYWYSGYYTSSEREPFTHTDRLLDLNRIGEEELVPKGYIPLNIYDLSAAWTFDAAAQRDGMHILGPPMRMGVTKVFHHLCSDVVPGRRV